MRKTAESKRKKSSLLELLFYRNYGFATDWLHVRGYFQWSDPTLIHGAGQSVID
jgi:hypothetical protein